MEVITCKSVVGKAVIDQFVGLVDQGQDGDDKKDLTGLGKPCDSTSVDGPVAM